MVSLAHVTVNSPDLLGLVQALRERPSDDATRAVLADMLDEVGPSPVETGEVPNWVRLCWLRQGTSSGRHRGWSGGSKSEVGMAIGGWFDDSSLWDHWGTTEVAGLKVLVSEPYCKPEALPEVFRDLAALLVGTAHAYAINGWPGRDWKNRGNPRISACGRAILFPPLVMPPPKRKQTKAT